MRSLASEEPEEPKKPAVSLRTSVQKSPREPRVQPVAVLADRESPPGFLGGEC